MLLKSGILGLFLMFWAFGVESKTIYLNSSKDLRNENPISILKGDLNVSIKFNLNRLELNNAKYLSPYISEFETVAIMGLSNVSEAGKPALPYKSFLFKSKPENLNLIINKGKSISLDIIPKPAETMPCRCKKVDEAGKYTIEGSSYIDGQDNVVVEYLGDFRGEPLTKVTIRPFVYSKSKGLVVNPNLEIKISNKYKPNILIEDIGELVKEGSKEYLIVGPERLVSNLTEFIEHKESLGFSVEVYNLEDIGNNTADIKSFFHSKYKESKYSYALIVGHEDNFATEYIETSNDIETPSDLRYFTMGGEEDSIPDVFYGRMVVSNSSDIKNQVAKILNYEKGKYKGQQGWKKIISIASDEGANPNDVEYVKAMAKPFVDNFNFSVNSFFQENSNSTARNINKVLKSGAAWLNYIGHGVGDSWPSINSGEYNSTDIKDLNSGVVNPVIIDVACQNGRFRIEGRLGERFMNESKNTNPIGAVAYYGGSVDISWHPPAKMAVYINEIIVNKNIRILGAALLAGQIKLLETSDNSAEAKENLVWYHLFGDPSLKLNF